MQKQRPQLNDGKRFKGMKQKKMYNKQIKLHVALLFVWASSSDICVGMWRLSKTKNKFVLNIETFGWFCRFVCREKIFSLRSINIEMTDHEHADKNVHYIAVDQAIRINDVEANALRSTATALSHEIQQCQVSLFCVAFEDVAELKKIVNFP